MLNPENEMGVIVRFAQMCKTIGYTIVKIRAAFPDAIIENNAGIQYRAEFEFMASNFISHRHDPRNCDLLICWINDLDDDFPLTIWELSSLGSEAVIVDTPEDQKEIAFLRMENKYLRKQVEYIGATEDAEQEDDECNPGDYRDYVLELLNENGELPLTEITFRVNRDNRVNFSHTKAKGTWYKYLKIWKTKNR
jgi:hypothetical protein